MTYTTINFIIFAIFVLIGLYVFAMFDLTKIAISLVCGLWIIPIVLIIANLSLAIKLKDYSHIKYTFIPILIPIFFCS